MTPFRPTAHGRTMRVWEDQKGNQAPATIFVTNLPFLAVQIASAVRRAVTRHWRGEGQQDRDTLVVVPLTMLPP